MWQLLEHQIAMNRSIVLNIQESYVYMLSLGQSPNIVILCFTSVWNWAGIKKITF